MEFITMFLRSGTDMSTRYRSASVVAVVAALLGSAAVIPAVIAQQIGFAFEYSKSGGVAGINDRISFESQASDGRTNIIKLFREGKVAERTLSAQAVESLMQNISGSGFFDLESSYPANVSGAADYFSYSLTVTAGGRQHSVSWVDQFASSAPVPGVLPELGSAIEAAYADAESPISPPLDDGRRRITETLVRQSSAHDAEGHASHQAAYLLLAQPGYLYSGAVTFSSTRPVDILAYHDITGTDTSSISGIPVHVVDGRTFAVTTLLRNVTSGATGFVASGILAHITTTDPFALVASVDVLRKISTAPASEKSFTIDVTGEKFVIRATDSETITQLTDNYFGKNSMHVTGKLVKGDGGFNQPWGWHLDPASVRMAEFSIELCDGRPSMIQEDLEYWLGTVGSYCPWSSKVVAIN
jgi:hypothetical protein